MRMGRFNNNADDVDQTSGKFRARPLKIELGLVADCKSVLSSAKWLNKYPATIKVYICQLLPRSELEKLKVFRRRCDDLNKSTWLSYKGSKRFIVLSSKLMIRASND